MRRPGCRLCGGDRRGRPTDATSQPDSRAEDHDDGLGIEVAERGEDGRAEQDERSDRALDSDDDDKLPTIHHSAPSLAAGQDRPQSTLDTETPSGYDRRVSELEHAPAEPLVEPFGLGPGWQEVVGVATPAAGLGFTYTIQSQYIEHVQAVTCLFVASAAVVNRFPVLRYQDANGNDIARVGNNTPITASQTVPLCWFIGAGAFVIGATVGSVAPLPDMYLEPTRVVRLTVVAIDAADQVSAIFVTTDRFLTMSRRPHRYGRRGIGVVPIETPPDEEDLSVERGTGRENYYR